MNTVTRPARKTNHKSIPVAPTAPRSHEELRALYLANAQDQLKSTFDGFTTAEIAAYNGRIMFGANNEAFPSQEEWSRIVD